MCGSGLENEEQGKARKEVEKKKEEAQWKGADRRAGEEYESKPKRKTKGAYIIENGIRDRAEEDGWLKEWR